LKKSNIFKQEDLEILFNINDGIFNINMINNMSKFELKYYIENIEEDTINENSMDFITELIKKYFDLQNNNFS
jgi:Fe-S cluster assembly iron-binding protein IscA